MAAPPICCQRRRSSTSLRGRCGISGTEHPVRCAHRDEKLSGNDTQTLAADWKVLLSVYRPRRNCLLPGEDEADVAGHTARILEHLGLEVEAEWSQVLVPEFVSGFGPALQRRFPSGLRVVDPSAAIAAQHVGKAVDLNFT